MQSRIRDIARFRYHHIGRIERADGVDALYLAGIGVVIGGDADNIVLRLFVRWDATVFLHRTGTDKDEGASLKRTHRYALQLTRMAHQAGIPILAGTDSLDPFVLHGTALHEELEYLARAGLSPVEVLRAATISPATTIGATGETGQIDVGQKANLILLTRNPLMDINATRSIDTVVAEGVVYNPQDRAAMMAFVRLQANNFAVSARSWWALLGFTA